MKDVKLTKKKYFEGVNYMGFVEMPAIEIDGLYFSKEKEYYTMSKETKEEGLFVAPAMIAEKRIPYFNPETNERYNHYFDAETIKDISQSFFIDNNMFNVNEEHKYPLNDIHVVYSWLVYNEYDPIMTHFGFKDIPVGSWILMYKINNEEIKQKIKDGKIKGLSIEGYFTEEMIKHNYNEDYYKSKIEEIEKMINNI